MRIKVGLAQIYPKLGDLAYNLQVHLDYVRQAREQSVDLLVFPELSLTGYQVQDLVPEVAIETDAKSEVFGALLKASAEIDIVVGFVHRDRRNRFYIANAYLSAEEALHVHHISSTCRPTPCSTNRAISRKATASAPLIRALAAWAC